jgi:hypothetical protein
MKNIKEFLNPYAPLSSLGHKAADAADNIKTSLARSTETRKQKVRRQAGEMAKSGIAGAAVGGLIGGPAGAALGGGVSILGTRLHQKLRGESMELRTAIDSIAAGANQEDSRDIIRQELGTIVLDRLAARKQEIASTFFNLGPSDSGQTEDNDSSV